MWRRRTASSCRDILVLSLGQDLFSEVAGEERRCVQVHLSPKDPGELPLHLEEGEAGDLPGLEFDEHVHVARRPEVVSQDGPE
jgi:hypothetical protein